MRLPGARGILESQPHGARSVWGNGVLGGRREERKPWSNMLPAEHPSHMAIGNAPAPLSCRNKGGRVIWWIFINLVPQGIPKPLSQCASSEQRKGSTGSDRHVPGGNLAAGSVFSSGSPKTLQRDSLRDCMEQFFQYLPTKKLMKGLMVLLMQASRKPGWERRMMQPRCCRKFQRLRGRIRRRERKITMWILLGLPFSEQHAS